MKHTTLEQILADMTAECFSTPFGESLPYRLYTPPNINKNERIPVILFLHGSGERGCDNKAQVVHGVGNILDYLQASGTAAYVIAPQCPTGMQWVNTPWDSLAHPMPEFPSFPMKLALELIATKLNDLPIDPKRIYVTGLSMGGYGTWDALQRQPARFAAGVPICGGGDPLLATRLKTIPVRVYHGDMDSAVPVERSRSMVAAIEAVGGKVTYTEYPGVGHNSWEKAYSDPTLYAWLFTQRRRGKRT